MTYVTPSLELPIGNDSGPRSRFDSFDSDTSVRLRDAKLNAELNKAASLLNSSCAQATPEVADRARLRSVGFTNSVVIRLVSKYDYGYRHSVKDITCLMDSVKYDSGVSFVERLECESGPGSIGAS